MSSQPDLFVRSAKDLRQEMRRHGGGTPPRWGDEPERGDREEPPDFSPVQFAEHLRALERDHGIVKIRQVDLNRLAQLLL